jgi:type I restriction enzyme M protein
LYRHYVDVDGHVKVVTLDEIAQNDWNLNIPRYVEPVIEEEVITVEEALNNLKTSLQNAYDAESKLKYLLHKAGLIEGEE